MTRQTDSLKKPFALITGGSIGLGKAFAEEFASRKINLLLVSLPNENLKNFSRSLEKNYGIQVHSLEYDLLKDYAIEEVFNYCRKHNLKIKYLVNNIGKGYQNHINNLTTQEILNIMKLNMEVAVEMTQEFLKIHNKKEKSYLLFVGSSASYCNIPFKTAYSASKKFILAYSNSLNYELKKNNVLVSCLCPGPIITNKMVEKRTKDKGLIAKSLILRPEVVARKAIKGLMKEKRVIIPGLANKILIFITRLFPEFITTRILGWFFARTTPEEVEIKEKLIPLKKININ